MNQGGADEQFEKVRSQEYAILREELKINRQFVFERPLLIVGASFAVLANAAGKPGLVHGMVLFALFLLFFNLWFTFNRLSSSARILGYLRVVHESNENVKRPGWENALSLQRKWLATHPEERRSIESGCANLAMHDANRFYGGIFLFHLVTGGLVLSLGLSSPVSFTVPTLGMILECTACGVYVLGAVMALKRWNPYRPKNSLEVEALLWRQILKR